MIQLVARSKTFHYAILKTIVGIQDFSLFSQQNLPFKHFLEEKIDLEDEETRDSRIEMSKQFDYSKHLRMVYIIKEHMCL